MARHVCPCCASDEAGWVHDSLDLSFAEPHVEMAVHYWVCSKCTVIFKSDYGNHREVKSYYTDAWQHVESRPRECFDTAAEWIKEALDWYPHRAFRRAVDIGAKDGELFDAMHRYGLSIGERELRDAKPAGDEIEKVWIGDGVDAANCYDLICATHVLEHAISPLSFLLDLRQMLTEDGYLYIEVPSLEVGGLDLGGPCSDDINRNHLFHFTVTSLVKLCTRAYLDIVRIDADEKATGWPCLRLLARRQEQTWKRARQSFLTLELNQKRDLHKKSQLLRGKDPSKVALYGASGTWFELIRHHPGLVGKFRVFDLYKHGQTLVKTPIEDPALLSEETITEVFITSRHWNSVQDIERYLATAFPNLKVSKIFYD
jgi:hypothetical protein